MDESTSDVHLILSRRDAELAVEHLRYLADREAAADAAHAKANLTARFVADEIERGL